MVDKKIFERRAKNNGGTILIDVSGSMQLNDEMILLLIEKKPAAKIAIYAGNFDSNQGTVRVIVQKGKAAAPKDIDVDSLGGGNVVDYPALLWLIQQEKPYFWICDGQLTGRNDSGYTSINVGCSKIQKRANILRWSSVKRFLEGQRGQLNISSREED
jgi:hypothetical protein